jgi:hypothetical protein
MNITDKAWEILTKFVPKLTLESFNVLSFDRAKSNAENKEIMMNEIARGKLGPILAIGAIWFLKYRPSSEESEEVIKNTDITDDISIKEPSEKPYEKQPKDETEETLEKNKNTSSMQEDA